VTGLACGGLIVFHVHYNLCVLHLSETVKAPDRTCWCVRKIQCPFCLFSCFVCICNALLPECVCTWCQADMCFTLVLFDVSIRGLSPPTSTLLFDLHQSGPDHSAFVYFQRHFSFFLVSLTPTYPFSLSLKLCVCVQVWMSFVLWADVCLNNLFIYKFFFLFLFLHLFGGPALWVFVHILKNFLFIEIKRNIIFTLDMFVGSWLEIIIMIWRQTLGFEPKCRYMLWSPASSKRKYESTWVLHSQPVICPIYFH